MSDGDSNNLNEFTEFETKYSVESGDWIAFKNLVSQLPGLERFLYTEGPDYYFVNDDIEEYEKFKNKLSESLKRDLDEIINKTYKKYPPFIRYRRPVYSSDKDTSQELTTKYKSEDKNNFNRQEKNLKLGFLKDETVKAFIEDVGYKYKFAIWKSCHIYIFSDACVVFYGSCDSSDKDDIKKINYFIEIEVREDKISSLTKEEAWAIIHKYEKVLEPIGINSKKRLKKSLFEIYSK